MALSFGEMMFYAEAEGKLPTREGRINALINWLKEQDGDRISAEDFYDLYHDHGLTNLSNSELQRIQKESGVTIFLD